MRIVRHGATDGVHCPRHLYRHNVLHCCSNAVFSPTRQCHRTHYCLLCRCHMLLSLSNVCVYQSPCSTNADCCITNCHSNKNRSFFISCNKNETPNRTVIIGLVCVWRQRKEKKNSQRRHRCATCDVYVAAADHDDNELGIIGCTHTERDIVYKTYYNDS